MVALLLAGCASKEVTRSPDKPEEGDELRGYEAQFDPAEYDPPIETILQEDAPDKQEDGEHGTEATAPEPAELVPGFRVQLFASANIDEARETKALVDSLFPEIWFYLVYDPPNYKIRGGNFVARFEASRFARQLSDRGFTDAWIVPERVYKNPPPRPLPQPKK